MRRALLLLLLTLLLPTIAAANTTPATVRRAIAKLQIPGRVKAQAFRLISKWRNPEASRINTPGSLYYSKDVTLFLSQGAEDLTVSRNAEIGNQPAGLTMLSQNKRGQLTFLAITRLADNVYLEQIIPQRTRSGAEAHGPARHYLINRAGKRIKQLHPETASLLRQMARGWLEQLNKAALGRAVDPTLSTF